MEYTLNQLYEQLYQKIYDTYAVFQNFFGEQLTDLQKIKKPADVRQNISMILNDFDTPARETEDEVLFDVSDTCMKAIKGQVNAGKADIYVWWSSIVVTNKNDKSVRIQDLYAKITIDAEGRIPYKQHGFLLNRATYTKEQFLSDYMHSHIQGIPKSNFQHFLPPCLGTGPIKDTIATLKNEADEVTWMLFCQELANYVTVESLKGVPWRHLEDIGHNSTTYYCTDYNLKDAEDYRFVNLYPKEKLKDFMVYYLKHGHFSLSYKYGKFTSGMSFYDYIIDVSNAFIDFFNLYLKSTRDSKNRCFIHDLLVSVETRNGRFYHKAGHTNPSDLSYYQDRPVLTFKGKQITTTIVTDNQSESVSTTILNYAVAMYILRQILRTINYRYRNEYKHRTDKDPASAGKRVFYL